MVSPPNWLLQRDKGLIFSPPSQCSQTYPASPSPLPLYLHGCPPIVRQCTQSCPIGSILVLPCFVVTKGSTRATPCRSQNGPHIRANLRYSLVPPNPVLAARISTTSLLSLALFSFHTLFPAHPPLLFALLQYWEQLDWACLSPT